MSEEVTEEVTESFLSKICKEIRDIFTNNSFMEEKLQDTKRIGEQFIGNAPLNWKSLNRDYNCSVYHTCREKPKTEDNVAVIEGLVYLDFARKVNSKSELIVTDELDKFAWTALQILYTQYPDLNQSVDEWKFIDKQIWRSNPSGSDQMPDEKLLHYICQVTLLCTYTYDFNY